MTKPKLQHIHINTLLDTNQNYIEYTMHSPRQCIVDKNSVKLRQKEWICAMTFANCALDKSQILINWDNKENTWCINMDAGVSQSSERSWCYLEKQKQRNQWVHTEWKFLLVFRSFGKQFFMISNIFIYCSYYALLKLKIKKYFSKNNVSFYMKS